MSLPIDFALPMGKSIIKSKANVSSTKQKQDRYIKANGANKYIKKT